MSRKYEPASEQALADLSLDTEKVATLPEGAVHTVFPRSAYYDPVIKSQLASRS